MKKIIFVVLPQIRPLCGESGRNGNEGGGEMICKN